GPAGACPLPPRPSRGGGRATGRGTPPARRLRPRSPPRAPAGRSACGSAGAGSRRRTSPPSPPPRASARVASPPTRQPPPLPPPRGNQPEEHCGAGEVTDGGRDRPVVAMEGDLDAAADRRAVDRRERDEGQLPQPAEELVTRPATFSRALGRDAVELAQVGSGGEDEGLARQDEA